MKTRMQQWIVGVAVVLALAMPAWATKWWDTNGSLAGSGNSGGNWNDSNWTSDSTGSSATGAWGGDSEVTFSAGTDGTGTFTVNLASGVSFRKVTIEEGNVTLGDSGGSITLNGDNFPWGVTGSLAVNVPIDLGSNRLTLQPNNVGNTVTISRIISGSGPMTLQGSGAITLSGLNTFTGAVFDNNGGGALNFNSVKIVGGGASALGAPTTVLNGTISLNTDCTLNYTGTGDTTDRALAFTGGDRSIPTGTGVANLPAFKNSGTGTLTWNGDFSSVNSVTLKLDGSTTGVGVLGGNITDASNAGDTTSIYKTGTGTWVLSGNNTHEGPTYLAAGELRVGSANALGTGNVEMDGGILQLAAGNLARDLGGSPGQIRWQYSTSQAGFSAYGANRTVNLNSGATLTWGVTSGFFNGNPTSGDGRIPLLFGSATANSELDFQNPMNFNGNNELIQVDDNSSTNTDVAKLSGTISNGGLRKTGIGTLILSGSNTFVSGQGLAIYGGVVRLSHTNALPGGTGSGGTCNLGLFAGTTDGYSGGRGIGTAFTGGVVELTPQSGDFTRALGTGANQVTWLNTFGGSGWQAGNGGFSAYGGDRIVNLGGAAGTVTWSSTFGFLGDNKSLIFGSSTANAQIEFKNPINLNGAVRTVQVDDNIYSITDQALMSGVLSDSVGGGGLLKTGAGKLVLGVNETYAGATTVSNGTLVVNGSLASSGITVNPLGTLGGTGTLSGAVSLDSGATIAPGNTTGTLTVAALSAASGAVWRASVQADRSCGKLVATGALNVTNVQLVVTGTLPTSGYVVLASGAPLTSPFQSVSVPPKANVMYVGNEVRLSGATKGLVLAVQ